MTARKRAPAKPAPAKAPPGTVLVQVADPFQVSVDGKVFGPGESVAVEVELAEVWRVNGWVTLSG